MCTQCKKTFSWKNKFIKAVNEKHWFKLWIKEGYSTRQLAQISGHSEFKLKNIKNYWLDRPPANITSSSLTNAKYIVFDGTYFHKDGCLAVIADAVSKHLLAYWYIDKESYQSVLPMIISLRQLGLNPLYATVDGHPMVIKALQEVWPKVLIQRCLYHIKYQGTIWLRFYPKTQAGKSLKMLLSTITSINTPEDLGSFVASFSEWMQKNKSTIKTLPKTSVAHKDLKRAMSLVKNALPNMFHYVEDQNIPSTTNMLEGLFSQIKHHCMRHRGLSRKNKVSYLLWFCYYWNEKTNKK